MHYAAKHAAAKRRPFARRIAGVAALGAATLGGSLVTAQSAHADNVWDRVAACESSGNWSINTGNGFYGGVQFTSQTWAGFGGHRYASQANRASKAQQIAIARKVLKVQGPGAWPVCSVKAGLTRANGGAVGAISRTTYAASRSSVRSSGNIAVDGVRGPNTNRAIESWVGGTRNGHLSHADVRKMQHKLGVAADGVVGPRTVRALQRRVGAVQDGVWGARTTSHLQRTLNRVL